MAQSMGYLASHSRNFEALLQTYRQINLTIQSVFLILGTFLLSRIVESRSLETALFMEFLLLALTLFSNIVMWKFSGVIRARGEDVNWWHKHIVRMERELPPDERAFTLFRVNQSRDVLDNGLLDSFLDEESSATETEIRMLLDVDIDHIRRVINTYILRGMRLIWLFIVIISLMAVLRLWGYVP